MTAVRWKFHLRLHCTYTKASLTEEGVCSIKHWDLVLTVESKTELIKTNKNKPKVLQTYNLKDFILITTIGGNV